MCMFGLHYQGVNLNHKDWPAPEVILKQKKKSDSWGQKTNKKKQKIRMKTVKRNPDRNKLWLSRRAKTCEPKSMKGKGRTHKKVPPSRNPPPALSFFLDAIYLASKKGRTGPKKGAKSSSRRCPESCLLYYSKAFSGERTGHGRVFFFFQLLFFSPLLSNPG